MGIKSSELTFIFSLGNTLKIFERLFSHTHSLENKSEQTKTERMIYRGVLTD